MIFLTILLGLLPSFLMVGLGGIVRNRLSVNAWQGLDKLNFEILFPALLFVSAASRPIEVVNLLRMAPAVWGILLSGLLLGYLVRRIGPADFLDFAGAWQTAWRFNSAIGLVAVGTLSRANEAQMAVAIGLAVPVANIFAVSALSRGSALGPVAGAWDPRAGIGAATDVGGGGDPYCADFGRGDDELGGLGAARPV